MEVETSDELVLQPAALIEKIQEVLQPLEPCLLPSSVSFCANYRISYVIYIEQVFYRQFS